ncbi:PREDICTED: uncharacterized protein LOC108563400 [Nicrophorus vespilloides]|uniref:Uncharacterized protein LOC108563400 n=1 Tax=Nicrophorus vespilloides TaxID=110193 RepID=A0ABM1MSK0_NICVS|nr:PREDICTED: uncharacterized protein LOC108563400 [Nicrophorus vespilloides]
MRIIFVVIVLAVTLISAEFPAWTELNLKMANYSQRCKELSQVDPDLITKAHNNEFVEDPKYMQFSFCMTKSLNVFDAEGNYKEKNLLTNLMDNAYSVLKKCKAEGEKETGNGKRSFIYLRCLYHGVLNDVNFTMNALE